MFNSLEEYIQTVTERFNKPRKNLINEGILKQDLVTALIDVATFVSITNSSEFIQASIEEAEEIKNAAGVFAADAEGIRAATALLQGLVAGDLVAVESLKNQAQALLDNALVATNPKGEWNVATNVPALSAIPVAGVNGTYHDITGDGLAPFSGSNFTAGVTTLLTGGKLIKKNATEYFYQGPVTAALSNLNGTKIPNSGKTTGLFVPELQYQHPRGETEIIGNGQWSSTDRGVMFFDQISEAVNFNRVVLAIWSNTRTIPITARIYKSATGVINPSLMTLLTEKIIPAGQFNYSSAVLATIDLDTIVRVKPSEYVYVAIIAADIAKFGIKLWNVDSGAAPARHGFLRSPLTNEWTTPWIASSGSSGFYQTSFNLLLINESEKTKELYSNLPGIKAVPADGNALYGMHLPAYQYLHERGLSEISGTHEFSAVDQSAMGWYEPITKPVSFNRVILSARTITPTALTVKVFRSEGFINNPSLMTELATVNYASGAFNSVAGANQVIDLPNYVSAKVGTYIFVFLYAGAANKFAIRRFVALAGSGTERHSFLYLPSVNPNFTNPWVANFDLSTANNYQTSFALVDSATADSSAILQRISVNEVEITELKTTTVKKTVDGSLKGSFVPVIQFEHVRATTEMLGNAGYTAADAYGIGSSQLMSTDVVFNKVEIPIKTLLSEGFVTVRIYRQTTASEVPGNMILLHTQDIDCALFNKLDTAFQTIVLPNPAFAAQNDTIHAYVYSGVSNNIQTRYWSADSGTAPLRGRFKRKTSLNGWDTAWSSTSGGFYVAPMRLSLVDTTNEQRMLKLEYKNPRLILPSKIYAIVGTELSIFYDAVVFGKDFGLSGSQEYTVTFGCTRLVGGVSTAVGKMLNRCWRINAISDEVGTHALTCVVFDKNHAEIARKVVSLIIVDKVNPATVKYYNQNGDSMTGDGNSRVAIAERMATLTGGVAPVSTGLLGNGAFGKHEGHGGWKTIDFVTDGMAAAQGPLGNPYWNTATNSLDITSYRTVKLGLTEQFNLFSTQLGVNDMRTATYLSDAIIQLSIDRLKVLINSVLADSPGAKIIVQLPATMRNTPISTIYDPYITNMWRFREMIVSNFDNFAFHAQVYVGQVGICIDRWFGYRLQTDVAGSRYTETETNFTDDVHLRAEGYKQMGDALFPQFIGLMQ